MSCQSDCGKVDLDNCVSIVPSDVCLRLIRNTDVVFEFILTDGEGEPVDISLDDVKLTVREYHEASTYKIQKTNLPTDHLDGPNGRTSFRFTRADISEEGCDRLFWVYEVRRCRPAPSFYETVHITGDFVVDPVVGG